MTTLPVQTKEIDKAGGLLRARKESIGVAESVTAGLLQLAFAAGRDAMHYFQGGITAYNLGQKARHLRIEPIHAFSCNCVSKKVAEQMAAEACNFFQSDWGIAVTGYASPVPESGDEVFAFFAIAHKGECIDAGKIDGLGNCDYANQLFYTEQVVRNFFDLLKQRSSHNPTKKL